MTANLVTAEFDVADLAKLKRSSRHKKKASQKGVKERNDIRTSEATDPVVPSTKINKLTASGEKRKRATKAKEIEGGNRLKKSKDSEKGKSSKRGRGRPVKSGTKSKPVKVVVDTNPLNITRIEEGAQLVSEDETTIFTAFQEGGENVRIKTEWKNEYCHMCNLYDPPYLTQQQSVLWQDCDGCKSWFHVKCILKNKKVVKETIVRDETAGKITKFFCQKCTLEKSAVESAVQAAV
jgi:rRNA-processing protein FCF1